MLDKDFIFLNDFKNRFLDNLIKNFSFLVNSKEKIKIMVGVSGGSDSICLLYLLYELNEKKFFDNVKIRFKFDITAVHINHMLRGKDSDEDEQFVEDFCKKLQIKYIIKKLDFLKNYNFGIEEKARKERYNTFYNIGVSKNIKYLFLAHNYDDDAETIFMKILRGTGIDGMLGIKNIRANNNKNFFIIRPLLIFTKKEIEKYLFLKNIKFRLDKTNLETDFFRNKIRNIIFPQLEELGNIKKNLLNIKSILEEENKFFNEYFFENNKGIINILGFNKNPIILDNKRFLEKNKNFLLLSLHNLLKNRVNFVHIKTIKDLFLEKNDLNVINSNLYLKFNKNKNKDFKFDIKNNLMFISKNNQSFLVDRSSIGISNFFLNEEDKLDQIILKLNELFLEKKNENLDDVSFFYEIIEIKNIDDFLKNNFLKEKTVGYFDYDLIKKYIGDLDNLIFRKRCSGDIFMPFGTTKIQKIKDYLSKQKLVKKAKIFLANRNSNEIFWVIGDRISDKLKVSYFTKKILKIEINLTKELV